MNLMKSLSFQKIPGLNRLVYMAFGSPWGQRYCNPTSHHLLPTAEVGAEEGGVKGTDHKVGLLLDLSNMVAVCGSIK